jgi:hypothetical protein
MRILLDSSPRLGPQSTLLAAVGAAMIARLRGARLADPSSRLVGRAVGACFSCGVWP